NPKPHKVFSTTVRELSVTFTRRRQWRNSQNARGAAMKDARIRRTNGQNCAMVVANVERRLLRRWKVEETVSALPKLRHLKRRDGRRIGKKTIALLLLRLNHFQCHFNRLGDGCLARLIPDDGQAVLAQPLRHLLLSQAETFPLSPERVFVHCVL